MHMRSEAKEEENVARATLTVLALRSHDMGGDASAMFHILRRRAIDYIVKVDWQFLMRAT